MSRRWLLLVGLCAALLLVVWTPGALGHGGGLDAFGCHHNRKAGGYHCHRGRFTGSVFSSKAAMLQVKGHESGRPSAPQRRRVIRVIDGDTLLLDGDERVRLIGVDTPETVHPTAPVERFGKEAGTFTRRLVEGKRIRLEYDQANGAVSHKDRYGRTLAYVFLGDGTFLNAEIVRRGYGHAYTRFPFRYLEEFRRYEQEAREARRGLWRRP